MRGNCEKKNSLIILQCLTSTKRTSNLRVVYKVVPMWHHVIRRKVSYTYACFFSYECELRNTSLRVSVPAFEKFICQTKRVYNSTPIEKTFTCVFRSVSATKKTTRRRCIRSTRSTEQTSLLRISTLRGLLSRLPKVFSTSPWKLATRRKLSWS